MDMSDDDIKAILEFASLDRPCNSVRGFHALCALGELLKLDVSVFTTNKFKLTISGKEEDRLWKTLSHIKSNILPLQSKEAMEQQLKTYIAENKNN